jgi:hypothetical protein
VVVATGLSVSDAATTLRRLVHERHSIEVAANVASDRRLVGSVTGARADLSVWDERLRTRRKSWNIEFLGTREQTPDGAILGCTDPAVLAERGPGGWSHLPEELTSHSPKPRKSTLTTKPTGSLG